MILVIQTMQAQENAKGIKDQGVKSHTHQRGCCQYKVIYLGGGFNNPNANSNQRLYGKTRGIALDYSQTILRKPGFSIGFNIGGQYFTGNNDPFESSLPQPYLISNQISSTVTSSGDSKNSGYFIGVGPQFNIHFANHFVFSPIFQLGYFGTKQNESNATQTTLISGGAVADYNKTYVLISQNETKISGVGFVPKARLTYMITANIGVWTEINYLMGQTAKNNTSTFEPKRDSDTQTVFSVAQMDAGTFATTSSDAKYNALGLNFGVVFGFGSM
nr:hypothetical protein [Flavobacterium sp.]